METLPIDIINVIVEFISETKLTRGLAICSTCKIVINIRKHLHQRISYIKKVFYPVLKELINNTCHIYNFIEMSPNIDLQIQREIFAITPRNCAGHIRLIEYTENDLTEDPRYVDEGWFIRKIGRVHGHVIYLYKTQYSYVEQNVLHIANFKYFSILVKIWEEKLNYYMPISKKIMVD